MEIQRAIYPLIRLLEESKDSDVRYEIIISLGNLGENAVKPLIRIVDKENSSVLSR